MRSARATYERFRDAARHRLGMPAAWATRRLAGVDYQVRATSIAQPHVVDYDDAWLYACAQHASIAFDIGANVGQSALLMFAAKPLEQLVLVDANVDALAVAAEHMIKNHLSAACRFVPAFAGDEPDGSVQFWTVGVGAAGSMYKGHAETAARAGSVSAVPTVTIDQLCARFGVTPDLVKIDVEGAEHKVLVGATTCAARNQTRFIVEMHSPPELSMADNARACMGWADAIGYATWYLSGGIRLDSPDPIAHRGRCHLLFQPLAWPLPAWLHGVPQSAPLPGSAR